MAGVAVLVLALFASSVDADPRGGATTQAPAFHHVIVDVFENHSARSVLDYRGLTLPQARPAVLAADAVRRGRPPEPAQLRSRSCPGRRTARTTTARSASSAGGASPTRSPLARSRGGCTSSSSTSTATGRLRISGPEKARLPFLYFRDLLASDVAPTLDRFAGALLRRPSRAGDCRAFRWLFRISATTCTAARSRGRLFMRSCRCGSFGPVGSKGRQSVVVLDERSPDRPPRRRRASSTASVAGRAVAAATASVRPAA